MFVVYLSSQRDPSELHNAYGYYIGKCYTKDRELYPITDNGVTERTKQYTSKKRATKGAEAVFEKCGYVISYEVREI